MHPSPFLLGGPQFLNGVFWERGGDIFQGYCNVSTKNKLKSGMFNDKKKFINNNALLCND